MGDLGTGFTDDALKKVEGQIGRIYRQASKDVDAKLRDFTERHKAREAVLRANVAAGKMTQDDFDAWMRGQVFQGQMWEARKAAIDAVLLHADEAAANVINTGRIGVFAENANYIGYNLEQGLGVTSSFTLYNDTSVVRLFREHPDMLPRPTVEKAKAYGYYNRTINNCITQGIIQGESINKIARRISDSSGETNYKSAVRNARTAMTGAQNAGRIEGMRQAEKLGIDVQKQWVATLDNRTRDAHAELDGQIRDKDQPFDSALGPIMYPGDSSADPANVWNCRCSIIDYYPKYPSYGAERLDNETGETLPDMTYNEWKALKTGGTVKSGSESNFAEQWNRLSYAQRRKEFDGGDEQVESDRRAREEAEESMQALQHENAQLKREMRSVNREIDSLQGDNSEEAKARRAVLERRLEEIKTRRDEISAEWTEAYNKASPVFDSVELTDIAREKGVEYVIPDKNVIRLSENQIIDTISGGDMTDGSCASAALCYVGQIEGYNVHDFRGGESQALFSHNTRNLLNGIGHETGIHAINGQSGYGSEPAIQIIKNCEPGKQYYLCAGRHATIVRVNDSGDFEYLELQSGIKNGWKRASRGFDGQQDLIGTFGVRFGCEDTQIDVPVMIDVEGMRGSKLFHRALGYINTGEENQMKGALGHEK